MAASAARVATSRPFTLNEAIRHFARRWYLVLVVLGLGTAGAVAVKHRFRPEYHSESTFRLTLKVQAPQLDASVTIPQEEPPEPSPLAQVLLEQVTSDASLQQLVRARPDAFGNPSETNQLELIKYLRKYANIVPQTDTMYRATGRAHSPEQAQAFVAWMTDSAIRQHTAMMRERAETLSKFTRGQAQKASKDLERIEDKMLGFLRANPDLLVRTLDSDRRLATTGPDRMRVQANRRLLDRAGMVLGNKDPALKSLLDERTRLQAELRNLSHDDNAPTSVAGSAMRELQRARVQLSGFKAEGLGDDHPSVKQVQRRIKELEDQVAQAKPGQVTGASAYALRVQARLRELDKRLKSRVGSKQASQKKLPRLEAQWGEMSREQRLQLQRFEGLDRLAAAAAFALGAYKTEKLAAVVEQADVPTSPKGVKGWMVLAAGVLTSLLLGIGLALALGSLDKRLFAVDDVPSLLHLQLLARLPAQGKAEVAAAVRDSPSGNAELLGWSREEKELELGVRPRSSGLTGMHTAQESMIGDGGLLALPGGPAPTAIVQSSVQSMVLHNLLDEDESIPLRVRSVVATPPTAAGLFLATAPRSDGADQMRLLASRLQEVRDPPCRVVVVCSWEPRVGRTIVAANLALALAESRRRTLLIDTCGGDATLTRMLGFRTDDGVGLYEQLEGRMAGTTEFWTIYKLAETLSVIPASSVRKPMLPMLTSPAFGEMVKGLKEIFDVIVLDSRPMAEASDAVALQQLAEGTVLVAGRKRSTLTGVASALRQLEGHRVAGVVFNQKKVV
ncbi:MAG: hypothetical protein IT371_10670 [Deltaproteobacteria bacterium]|nr:hypothetical protein [Deltaproteobacteria bacterium]